MDFNKDVIEKSCRAYIMAHDEELKFRLNSKSVDSKIVSGFNIELTSGDYGDGFNFSCHAINLTINLTDSDGNQIFPCSADFVIKVVPGQQNEDEKVVAIKDNLIFLRK
jgi:hypothetical protein